MRRVLAAALSAALNIAGTGYATADQALHELSKDPKQWVMPLGNYAGHRYSALDQINDTNAGKLQVAWTFSTGALRGHAGAPLVVGNRMYIVTPFPNYVYALDLDNEGKMVWSYRPKQDPQTIPIMCCDTVNRGLAYSDGMLYLNQSDTELTALTIRSSGYETGRNLGE